MDLVEISYAGAALAGLLSFASPCILPLVPAYLCFLGGVSLTQLSGDGDRPPTGRVTAAAFAFVLGFATVFVAMGATASYLNRLLLAHMDWLAVVAGLVIIVFGLHYMGVLRVAVLDVEKRLHPAARPAGLAGAYLVGLAFAFGWSPCVGPVLAGILVVAASNDSPWYGTSLLGTYAAGMGLPFLAAALAAGPALRLFARLRRHMRAIELTIGGLLVATGLLVMTGRMAAIGLWLNGVFPSLGTMG